jgi:hypothetical protein
VPRPDLSDKVYLRLSQPIGPRERCCQSVTYNQPVLSIARQLLVICVLPPTTPCISQSVDYFLTHSASDNWHFSRSAVDQGHTTTLNKR